MTALYTFSEHKFTNAGKTGPEGPSLSDLSANYTPAWAKNTTYLNMTVNGFQLWTVPVNGKYSITCVGAHGAMGTSSTTGTRGGRGAFLTGTVDLSKNDVLRIVVGQGGSYSTNHGGGGGASYLYNQTNTKLLFVAGGGGGTRQAATVNGIDASTNTVGTTATNSSTGSDNTAYDNTTYSYNGKKATLGNGGIEGMPSHYGDSGAGINGDGSDDGTVSVVAKSLLSTAVGGYTGSTTDGAAGGFGGGGAGAGGNGGGGGGGYTGGNGGFLAGGGGSYINSDYVIERTLAIDTARSYLLNGTVVHGYINIKLLTSPATLSFKKLLYYQKYALNSTFTIPSSDIITNNTDTGSYVVTHSSPGNAGIITITNSANTGTITVTGIGTVTITSTIAATANFTATTVTTITVNIIGAGTTYSNVNLTSIDLSGTDLNGTIFSSCDLTSANLYGSTISITTDFSTVTSMLSLRSGRIIGFTTRFPPNYKII